MFQHLRQWFKYYFSDPQVTALTLTVLALVLIIEIMGEMLAPVIASIVIAYVLDEVVEKLVHFKTPRWLASLIVCLVAIGILLLVTLLLIPMLWQQLVDLFNELPGMIDQAQGMLQTFIDRHPAFISSKQVQTLLSDLQADLTRIGKYVISFSITSIPSMIEVVVYAVLIPIVVFFFLKDKGKILTWCSNFLPRHRDMMQRVWFEIDGQIANYIRGRVFEIVLVSAVTSAAFKLMGLKYAFLLGSMVGLAVIVPYIGEVVIAFPVLLIAFLQWRLSVHFLYFVLVYGIIITLESNLLVPLLFSETMDLHPLVIIVAILIFGGIWGFWGVFFAMPLATVVKAIIEEWPKPDDNNEVIND